MEGPRALDAAELDSLVRLCNLAFRPDGGDIGAEFAYFINESNRARLRVFVADGEVVAHCGYRLCGASILGARVTVGCVGAVCTHPEHRGQGLATQLFADCIAAMKSEGADFAMISGGRGLYTRSGAVTAGRARRFRAESGPAAGEGLQVAPVAHGEASALAAIYRNEPVRFLRPPSEWADIVAGRPCMNRAARLWAIRRGGEVVAYAATREPWNDEERAKGMFLGEYAGCRRSLAAVLPELAERSGLPALEVDVRAWDGPLTAELDARGLAGEPVAGIGGTAKLVNFPQLMARLKDLLVERAGPRAARLEFGEADGKPTASLGAERLELDEGEACSAVFGTLEGSERGLLEGRGELGKVLGAALPVELPWYGYSYV